MKNFSIIFSILLLLLCTLFVSCSGLFESFNDDSSSTKTGYITLSVTPPRTVLPSADTSKLTNLVLTGIKTGSDSLEKTADTLSELTSQQIELETGVWSFTLSAKLNDVDFTSEAVSATVSVGQVTPLSFTLTSTEKGGFSLTVEFEGSATKAIAKLLGGGVEISGKTQEFSNLSENNITYTATDLEADTYTAQISFYGGENGDIALNTYEEYIRIANGLQSSATRHWTLNTAYPITYHILYNGEEGEIPAGASLPQAYSRKSEITLPTDITADGYCFGGWYKDADCTQAITSIEKGTTGAQDVYAMLLNTIEITDNADDDAKANKAKNLLNAVTKVSNYNTAIDWIFEVNGEVESQGAADFTSSHDNKGSSFTIKGKSSSGDSLKFTGGYMTVQTSKPVLIQDIYINGEIAPSKTLSLGGNAKIKTLSLRSGGAIKIISPLTAETPIATLSPPSYDDTSTQLLYVADGAGTTIKAECSKFKVMKRSTDTEGWYINTAGKLAQFLGSKTAPYDVGDIVFNDGTAIAYTSGMTFTDAQKANAIAIIFYKGTDCNNDGDTTPRTLGVGLKHSSSITWCVTGVNGLTEYIPTIECKLNNSADIDNYTYTGDRNGSDNLEQIGSYFREQNKNDDTGKANFYPAFYFGKNYKGVEGSNVSGTDYEDGWYLPSIAELYQVYKANKNWDINTASESLGGDTFGSGTPYWTASIAHSDVPQNAELLKVNPQTGGISSNTTKTMNKEVCAIREF